ncbi:MAG TPA: hypothetical protein VF623_06470 [Segetibacter sp.]
MKKLLLILSSVAALSSAQAQQKGGSDTTKRTVVVTSAYKPVLKPAVKINFSAAAPITDTSKPALVYKVPPQNLFFTYQPASLKPLALSVDTTNEWTKSNYVKVGYGNYSSPYAQVGLSFGDGKKSLLNVHARHISQKGNLPFQQYSHTNADLIGLYSTNENIEWRGKVGIDRSTQYYYGYQPDTLKYSKDSLRQQFMTKSLMVGVRNKETNSFGISYDPSLSINFFTDNRKGKETNILLNAPITKTINDAFSFRVGLTADMTNYRRYSDPKVKNNLYFITPAVLIKKPAFSLNLGIKPSWDNTDFHLLPDFSAIVKVADKPFVLQLGWIGYYNKNNYQSLAAFNPWILQPPGFKNTRVSERFAGFKGSGGSHFTYNAKLAVISYNNLTLFANDTADGKTFRTIYEPKAKNIQLHGEVGYTLQERFSFLAGATINKYSGLKENSEAWGLLPAELTGSLRLQILKDLQFKSDLFIWEGAQSVVKGKNVDKQKGAFDLNAGVEFTVMPKLNLWLQFNNILNNKYERWNQYQVLGFNVLGGVVYSF